MDGLKKVAKVGDQFDYTYNPSSHHPYSFTQNAS